MATAFKVQGELTLSGQQFVGTAREARTALEGVGQGAREAAAGARAATTATGELQQVEQRATQTVVALTQAHAAQAASARLVSAETRAVAQAYQASQAAAQRVSQAARAQAGDIAAAYRDSVAAAARASQASAEAQTQAVAQAYQASQAAAQRLGQATRAQTGDIAAAYRASLTAASRASQSFVTANEQAKKSTEALGAANENTAQAAQRSARQIAFQRQQLTFQLNDIFTSLVSGMNPLMVAVQQGPQITQIYGGVGATLARIPPVAGLAAAGLAAVAVAIGSGISAAASGAARQREFNVQLQATGNIAAVTAQQLDGLVKAEAQRAGAGRGETAAALGVLLPNPNLGSIEALERALAISRDLARAMGSDLAAGATTANEALEGTVAGVAKLDRQYNILTASELTQIRALEQQGRQRDAALIVLEAMERRFRGLNEQGLSPAARALNTLGNAWTSFADAIGRSAYVTATILGVTAAVQGLAWAVRQLPGAGGAAASPQDQLASARTALGDAENKLAELQRRNATPGVRPLDLGAQIASAEKSVAALRGTVQILEGQAAETRRQASAAEAERQKKATDAIVESLNVEQAARERIAGQRQQLQARLAQGDLSPDQVTKYREALVKLDEQVKALDKPSSAEAAAARRDSGAFTAIERRSEAYAAEVAGIERVVAAERVSAEAAREAERQNRVLALAVQLRADAAKSGSATVVAAAESEIAALDGLSRRQIAAERARAANQLNQQYDPEVAFSQQMADLRELEATGLLTARTLEDATRQAEQRRLEASRSATDGMIAGLRRYAGEAASAGQAAAQAVNQGLRSMEDTLVQFVATGKVEFGSLTNSIIADLARIAIRNGITGPLSSALGSALGGGSSGTAPGLFDGLFSRIFGSPFMHEGGIVGRDASFSRVVDQRVFLDAPRFHNGGIPGLRPNERPIVALDDEEVLTRSDPRHRWNLGRGSGPANDNGGGELRLAISVVNASGQPVSAEQGRTADGMPSLTLVLGQVKKAIADDLLANRGEIPGALRAGFGLQAVPR